MWSDSLKTKHNLLDHEMRAGGGRGARGFTLIELLVVATIFGVLVTLAVPGFIAFVTSTRLTAQINDLVADISYARSEAATRGAAVTICPSTTGTACASASAGWKVGRILFVDVNTNGKVDTAETILRFTPALSTDASLAITGFSTAENIMFRSHGGLAPATSGSFKLCSIDSKTGRQVAIPISGRPMASRVACP